MSTVDQSTTDTPRGERKVRQGYVVSNAMDKTIVVKIERRTTHPLYGKTVTRSEKYHAHDEANDVNVGDLVRIVETRPLSKTKRWRLLDVVERAK
jgi:small subunit ribosomal protein S17